MAMLCLFASFGILFPTTDLQAYDLYLRAQSISRLVKDTAELASLG